MIKASPCHIDPERSEGEISQKRFFAFFQKAQNDKATARQAAKGRE